MSSSEVKKILADEEKLAKVCKAVFEQVDSDKSGFIDEKELAATMKMLAGDLGIPEPSEDEVKEAYKALDTNCDGKISLDEFSVLTKQLLQAIAGGE